MNDNWIDDILDAHLKEAANSQPPLGMESRILTLISKGHKKARGRFFWVAWASTAITIFTIGVSFVHLEPTPPPRAVTSAKSAPAPPISSTAQARQPQITKPNPVAQKRQQERTVTAADSRPDVFPTPFALTEQERLALGYLRSTPRSELVAMSHRDEEPLLDLNEVFSLPAQEVNIGVSR